MAEILPINREDDGQTQLQEKNGVVSAVPQPTYPAINIPDVITQDFFNQPPSADRQRIENDLQQRRQEYLASFQPTAQEEQLGKEGLGLEQQRIAMPLITGQEAALRRQGQLERGDVLAQLENKQRSYGYEVEKRKGLIERGQAMLGFAESDLDRITKIEQNNQDMQLRILHYTQGLREKSRQVFGTIIKSLEGKRFSELSPEGQLEIQQMASQAGLPLNAIITGLDVQADAKEVELAKQEMEFGKFGLDIAHKKLEMEKLRNDMDNPALKSEDLGDKIGFFDKSGKMVSFYTKGIAPKAGGEEDDDDKPLNILDVQRYNELYPGAGVKAGDSATTANKKVANAKTPETDLKNMISLAKDNGNSYDIIVNEINNDPSIMDKETAIKIAKDIFGIEPVTTKGGLPDLGKLNPVEYLSNSIYNFLFK